MNKFFALFTTATLLALVTACGEKTEVAPDVSAAPTDEAVAPPVVYAAPVVSPVDTFGLNLVTDKFNSQNGELVDGRLVSNGKAGYFLYGPYVSVLAGTYTVAFKGKLEELPAGTKVHLDVASGKGKSVHGQIDMNKAGDLPAFEFTLPEAVGDLEVRINAPLGAKISVESYQVSKKI
jgi:hypothetical protein